MTTMSDTDLDSRWYENEANLKAVMDLAVYSGLVVKASADPTDFRVCNVSLMAKPSLFPEELFATAQDVQPTLNSVVDAISQDQVFMTTALER